ncbi:MAG: hypothetical protein AAF598_12100 [Bacteroidota bacterium]
MNKSFDPVSFVIAAVDFAFTGVFILVVSYNGILANSFHALPLFLFFFIFLGDLAILYSAMVDVPAQFLTFRFIGLLPLIGVLCFEWSLTYKNHQNWSFEEFIPILFFLSYIAWSFLKWAYLKKRATLNRKDEIDTLDQDQVQASSKP